MSQLNKDLAMAFSGSVKLDLLPLLEKHAPGKHNQQSHAGGRGKIYQDLGDWQEEIEPQSDEEESEQIREWTALSTSQEDAEGDVFIKRYVSEQGLGLNKKLRDGTADEEDEMDAQALDEIIDAAPRVGGFTTYRGVTLNGGAKEVFEKLEEGDIFQDPGFVSASLNPMIAMQMGGQSGLIFRIEVPPNSAGIFPNSFLGIGKQENPYAHEVEFLIPRMAKLEVIGREGKVWDMRLLNE